MNEIGERVLDSNLRLSNVRHLSFKAFDASAHRKVINSFIAVNKAQDRPFNSEFDGTHSKPASPVNVGSLEGFSNRHSNPACRHRRQGGLSAPSHRIFCFRQAFYTSLVRKYSTCVPFENDTYASTCEMDWLSIAVNFGCNMETYAVHG